MPDQVEGLAQDQEWCELEWQGGRRRIRLQDYATIYSIPGLYEHLFHDVLGCVSPETVCGLLAEQLDEANMDPADLVVLELGAGNGMVGERLAELGAGTIVAADIIEAAADAAQRDRPDVYDEYLVADLTQLEDAQREHLEALQINCMVSVAALGFGDLPPDAFAAAFNLTDPGGVIAFNLKDDFLSEHDQTGFAGMVHRMADEDLLEITATKRYCHRLSVDGQPIYYVALVGAKCDDVILDVLA